MGAWYPIGIAGGFGAAIGLLFSGVAAPRRLLSLVAVAVAATAVGALVGYLLDAWGVLTGGIGALLGVAVGAQLVRGAIAVGGTRAGTAALVGVGAAVVAALALVPVLGYLEAAVLPVLGARLRRRAASTYAGLRILARD